MGFFIFFDDFYMFYFNGYVMFGLEFFVDLCINLGVGFVWIIVNGLFIGSSFKYKMRSFF